MHLSLELRTNQNFPNFISDAAKNTFSLLPLFENDKRDLMDLEKAEAKELEDGSVYQGQFSKNGYVQGYGIKYLTNGTIMEGYWRKNLLQGKGRIIFGNGDYYEGNWDSGIINGHGILYNSNTKSKYTGEFVKGK